MTPQSKKLLIAAVVIAGIGIGLYMYDKSKKANALLAVNPGMNNPGNEPGAAPTAPAKSNSGNPSIDKVIDAGKLVFVALEGEGPVYAHITDTNVVYPMDDKSAIANGVHENGDNIHVITKETLSQFLMGTALNNGTLITE